MAIWYICMFLFQTTAWLIHIKFSFFGGNHSFRLLFNSCPSFSLVLLVHVGDCLWANGCLKNQMLCLTNLGFRDGLQCCCSAALASNCCSAIKRSCCSAIKRSCCSAIKRSCCSAIKRRLNPMPGLYQDPGRCSESTFPSCQAPMMSSRKLSCVLLLVVIISQGCWSAIVPPTLLGSNVDTCCWSAAFLYSAAVQQHWAVTAK